MRLEYSVRVFRDCMTIELHSVQIFAKTPGLSLLGEDFSGKC